MSKGSQRRPAESVFMDRLTSLVRAAYIDERRAWALRGHDKREAENYLPGPYWDGGKRKSNGRVTTPVWPRLAAFFVRHQVGNYLGYIHAQFLAGRGMGHAPTPLNLMSEAALERWRETDSWVRVGALQRAWEMQERAYRRALCQYRASLPQVGETALARSALLDEQLELTPLFRYCRASREGYTGVAKAYAEAALCQYIMEREAYDQAWKEWLTDGLRRAADRFHLSLD